MGERSAKDVVGEMFRRQQEGDETVLDDLVAEDMVNHAAGPQGCAVWPRSCAPSTTIWARSPSSSTT